MSKEDPQENATPPGKGGFGEFAQRYRDRWAANHPNSKWANGDGAPTPTPPTDTPSADDADSAADPQA